LKGALVWFSVVSHVIRNLHLGAALTKDLSFFRFEAKTSKERNVKYELRCRWWPELQSGGSGKVLGSH